MGQFFIPRSRNEPVFLCSVLESLYIEIALFLKKDISLLFRLIHQIIIRSAFPLHVDTMRLIMTQNLSPRTEPCS